MKKRLKVIATSILLILPILFLASYLYLVNSDPLKSYGMSYYNNEYKHIFLEITNEGYSNLKIKQVKINEHNQPKDVRLGISFTGRLVSVGIENEPKAKFVEIGDEPIHPKLPDKQLYDLIKQPDSATPIHYGIEIINEENVRVISIKYQYFGITKEKVFDLNEQGA